MIVRHPLSSFSAYFRSDSFIIVRMSVSDNSRFFYTSSGDTTEDIEGAREYATVLINPDNSYTIMAHKLSPSFIKEVFEIIEYAVDFIKETNKKAATEAVKTMVDLELGTTTSISSIKTAGTTSVWTLGDKGGVSSDLIPTYGGTVV